MRQLKSIWMMKTWKKMQVCKQKQACIPKMKEKNKWREIFKNYMHKENFGNHMEDYLCVGVFTMSMIM